MLLSPGTRRVPGGPHLQGSPGACVHTQVRGPFGGGCADPGWDWARAQQWPLSEWGPQGPISVSEWPVLTPDLHLLGAWRPGPLEARPPATLGPVGRAAVRRRGPEGTHRTP